MPIRRDPVGYTCPDIDVILEQLKMIVDICSDIRYEKQNMTIEDIHERLDNIVTYTGDIEHECNSIASGLEDLRKSNDALRGWAHELQDDLETVQSNRDELEAKVEVLQDQLNEINAY